jgi:hypothetical protein
MKATSVASVAEFVCPRRQNGGRLGGKSDPASAKRKGNVAEGFGNGQ